MNFQQSKLFLLDIFSQNNFSVNAKNKNRHATQFVIETCSNGTQISVSFPGYKAFVAENKIVYDYRVDIKKDGITTALSHANIITDIYNKIINGGMPMNELKDVLIKFSIEGNMNGADFVAQLPYVSVLPPKKLISKIKKAHGNKVYNEIGNSFDLTIEELIYSIKWIVLQEDINYPISEGYEGRRMSFARYLETLFITQNNTHTLEEVIDRALTHSRPVQWKEMDYSFRNAIK